MKKTEKEKWEIDMLVSVKVTEKEEDPNWFRADNTFMSGNVMRMAREAKELKKAVEDNIKARNELTKELSK